jgi:Tfp pilus assembly protein PilW
MTTSTPRIDPPRRRARPGRRIAGFTLVEVMVAATISTFVLAGVLSAFLLVGRSGFAASNYSEMESQMRVGLEVFGEEVRKATDIRWASDQCVTLFVATATNASTPVTYAYDSNQRSRTHGCFYRVQGEPDSTLPRRVLVRHVAPDFAFQRFKLEQDSDTENIARSDLETKQIQLTIRTTRSGATTVTTSQSALSARYILRNKRVSN